jgi:hypothetical protein
MVKIKWTPQSLDDIEAIANFIARDSDYYAQMFTTKVGSSLFRVGDPHPWMQFDKLGATTKTYLTGFTGLTG